MERCYDLPTHHRQDLERDGDGCYAEGANTIAAIARQLDDATVYRAYAAELQHGRRGALARAARKLGVSGQHVANVVRRHETAHPVIVSAPAPIAPPGVIQRVLEAPGDSHKLTIAPAYSQELAGSDNSLVYIPPPGGYAPPEPRKMAQNPASVIHRYPQPIYILSTPPMPTELRWQRFEFNQSQFTQLHWQCKQTPPDLHRRAANLSYGLAFALTGLSSGMMWLDLRLAVLWLVTLPAWYVAAECQRALLSAR